MGTLQDEILRATGGPTVNDGLRSFFSATALETLQDAELRFLQAQVEVTTGTTINDAWMQFLKTTPGTLRDKQLAYWTGQGVGPPVTANLEVHYQFNTGITVTGQGVSEWQDQTVNNRHLLQGTDANRPAKEVDGIITFDGVATFLATAGFTWNQPETVYLLVNQVTWTGGRRLSGGIAANLGSIYQRSSSPNIGIFAGAGSSNNGDLPIGSFASLAAVFNGAASLMQVDGNAPVADNAGTDDLGGFTLGAVPGGSNFSNIQVKEVLGYSAAHDAPTRAQIIAYLNSI